MPTATIARTPSSLRLVGHAVDGDDRPFERFGDDLAPGVDPLAEARHLGTVDDRVEPAVGAELGDVELDRVRPDVDHRVALGPAVEERREAARVVRVDVALEPDRPNRLDDRRRVLGLDGDGPDRRPSATTSETSDEQPPTV